MQALQWLKQHNPLYRDVSISNISEGMFVYGEEVTEGENGRQEENLEMDETGIVRLDALQPNVVAVELVQERKSIEHQVHELQRITATPLSIFEDRDDLEAMAFPTLYPDCENSFGKIRETKVSPLHYFQARLLSADTRWACHPSYIFWACNIVEALKLQSSISIAMRMRSFRARHFDNKTDNETDDEHLLTAGLLRGPLDDNRELHERKEFFS